jgi:hypothetical protein
MKDEEVRGLIESARMAPSGFGELASTWEDKPHRVVYDLCNTLSTLLQEREALRKALEPFAEFAKNIDQGGWGSNIHREGISTWFGLSDFYNARSALSPENDLVQPAADRGDTHCDHPISEDDATR